MCFSGQSASRRYWRSLVLAIEISSQVSRSSGTALGEALYAPIGLSAMVVLTFVRVKASWEMVQSLCVALLHAAVVK